MSTVPAVLGERCTVFIETAMILDMRGLREACQAPLFQLSLDNDWDEAAWSRLRSFLYYC